LRASNDAAVSIAPPKIPYGGFSPVRLQGRYFRRGLPSSRVLPSAGLPSPFVPIADHVASPYCAGERGALVHLRSSGFRHSTPGVLAPVRVLVSRSICTYLTPCAPLAGTSRLHRSAAYTGCHRCAPVLRRLGNPRLVLSFRGWSFATGRPLGPRGTLRLLVPSTSPKTLAFNSKEPSRHSRSSSHSDSGEGCDFGALLRFACATTCCFLSPPVGAGQICTQPTRAFTSGLPTVWSPAPPPDIATVPTG